MNIREELISARECNDEKNFNIMVEIMKRKADKGILEGVTSEDIDNALNELMSTDFVIVKENHESEVLVPLIYELSEACSQFEEKEPEALTESYNLDISSYKLNENNISLDSVIGDILS